MKEPRYPVAERPPKLIILPDAHSPIADRALSWDTAVPTTWLWWTHVCFKKMVSGSGMEITTPPHTLGKCLFPIAKVLIIQNMTYGICFGRTGALTP